MVKAPQVPSGRPAASITQRSAAASSATVAGVAAAKAVFWSQAEAIQSAARPTGYEPPMTQPKNREPAMAIVAGAATSASRRSASSGSPGPDGSGPSRGLRSTPLSGATGLSSMPSR